MSKLFTKWKFPSDMKTLLIELNICWRKRLFAGTYHGSQHFNVWLTMFQRCGSIIKQRWSDVGFSTLHNWYGISVQCWNNVEKMLHNVYKQRVHLNVIFRLVWRCDVGSRQINAEAAFCTTLENVETTL